jgi:hypothetical protein
LPFMEFLMVTVVYVARFWRAELPSNKPLPFLFGSGSSLDSNRPQNVHDALFTCTVNIW